jgi:hypothetical protein
MHPSQRIVTCLPLPELWDAEGPCNARRIRSVGNKEIIQLLRDELCFVVADVGQPLRWIMDRDRFAFWTAELKPRLVAPDATRFRLDDYPGGYCYVASEWQCETNRAVVVLEKHH